MTEPSIIPTAQPRTLRGQTTRKEVREIFVEEDYSSECCWGRLNVMHSLQMVLFCSLVALLSDKFAWQVALVSFLLDVACTFLTMETVLSYFFALSSVASLLCLSGIVSGVQEERITLVQLASAGTALKGTALVTLVLVSSAWAVKHYVDGGK